MNFFDQLGEMADAAKKKFFGNSQEQKQQGADTAPSLQSAWNKFVDGLKETANGLQDKFQDSLKQKPSLKPADDTSRQQYKMPNLIQHLGHEKKKSVSGSAENTGVPKAEEAEQKPWMVSASPFRARETNDIYHKTLKELDESATASLEGLDPLKDAFDMAMAWENDVFGADSLYDDQTAGRDPFKAAGKSWREKLDKRKLEYSINGKSGEELKALLEGSGYQSRSAIDEANQRAAIAYADKYNKPEENMDQATRDTIAAYNDLYGIIDQGKMYGWDSLNLTQMYALQNAYDAIPGLRAGVDALNLDADLKAQLEQYGKGMAAELSGKKELDYAAADKLISQNEELYDWAKSAGGDLAGTAAAMENMEAIVNKVLAGTTRTLTDSQRAALDIFRAQNPEMSLDVTVGGQLTPEQWEEVRQYGQQTAEALNGYGGMFNQYAPTMPQQVYRDAWRKTPEGAEAWVKEAENYTRPGVQGFIQDTDELMAARDNWFYINNEQLVNELRKDPDYNNLKQVNKELLNNPKYAVVNGKQLGRVPTQNEDIVMHQVSFLTQQEKDDYNAFANKEGLETANTFYNQVLMPRINERMAKAGKEQMQELGASGPLGGIAAFALSTLQRPLEGLGTVDTWVQFLRNVIDPENHQPIDPNTPFNQISQQNKAALQGIGDQEDWNMNILGQEMDVFDAGINLLADTAHSYNTGVIGGAVGSATGMVKLGKFVAALIMGLGSAQNTMQEGFENNRGVMSNMASGVWDGVSEWAGEEISLGRLIDQMNTTERRSFIRGTLDTLVSALVNGSEEGVTEWMVQKGDNLINGENSKYNTLRAEYERLDLSPEEAEQRAFMDCMREVALSAGSGTIMGGFMGGAENIQTGRNYNQMNRYAGSQIGQDTRNALWALAAMPEMQGTEAAKIAGQVSAQKANDKQVGELFRALSMGGTRSQMQSMGIENPSQTVDTGLYGQNPIGSAATEAMRKEFLIQMALRGGAMNDITARALADLMAGERLTEAQMNAVAADPAAMDIVNRVLAPNPDKATPRQEEARQMEQEQQAEDEEAPLEFEDVPGEPSPSADGATVSHEGEAFGAPSQPRQDAETPRQREAEQLRQEAERRAEETKQREAEAKAAQERLKEARDRIMAQEQAEREQAAAEAVKDQQAQAEARKAREAELRQLEEARNRLMAQEQEEREQAAAGAVADQQAQVEARKAREAELQRLEEARNRLMAQEQEEREQAAAKAVANQQAQAKAQKERAAELERLVAEDKAAQERLQEAKRLQQEAETLSGGEAATVSHEGEAFGAPTQPNPAKETPRQREAAQIPVKVKGVEKHVAGVRAQEDGSGIEVTTREGDTVDLDDIEAGEAEKEVLRAAADMEDTEAQTDMLSHYDGGSDTQAAHDYAAGYKAVHDAAAKGTSYEDVKSIYGDTLTEDQRKAAHETGRRWGEALREKKRLRNIQAADEAGFEALQEGTGNRGGVFFADVDSGMKNEDGSIDKAKRVQLRVLNDFGQKNGIQYRVVDKGADENAHYEVGTNVVYVALDAEGGALTRAASHETMHFIQEYAADMAQKIRDYVLERLKKVTGYDLEARIAEVMSQYTDHTGQPVTRAYAEEEIVADSLLDVIGTEEALSELAKKTGGGSAIEKIGNWIKKTYAQLRELVNRYAKNSPEARALKDDVDYLEQVTGLFDQAVKTAKYAYQQSQQGLYQSAAQDSSVKEYVQDMQTATTEDARRSALDGLVNDLFTRIFGDDLMKQAQQTGDMDAYETAFNEMLAQFRQALLDYKQQNIALSVALERNGLKGVPTGYNPALGYAAGQMVSQKAEAAVRHNLRQETETEKAARAAGYNIKAYHGTSRGGFTEFDGNKSKYGLFGIGFYFTEDPAIAEEYTHKGKGTSPQVYTVYLKSPNEMDMDAAGTRAEWARIFPDAARDGAFDSVEDGDSNETFYRALENFCVDMDMYKYEAEDMLLEGFQEAGYTGLTHIGGGRHGASDGTQHRVHIVFEAENIKSAEEITRDNQGNVIPLSQRFNDRNTDIRYNLRHDTQARQEAAATESVREDADLYAQVRQSEDARAALMLLERLHETTTGGGENALIQKGAFEKRLTEMVRKAKEATGTDMSEQKIRKLLRAVYGAMEQEGYKVGEVLRFTRDAFKQMLEAAPGTFVEQDETTEEIIQALKDNRFRLTADQKSEINGTYGSLGDFMRKNFGRLKIRNNAKITLSEMWRETLTPLNHGLFPEDANPLEMPGIIDTFLDNAKKKVMMNGAAEYIDGTSTELALNAMLDFYDVPGALKTKAEIREGFRQQLEADDAVFAAYEEKFEEARALVQQYKQDARQAVRMAKEQLQKEAAEKPIVKDIRRNVRVLTNMVMKGTDQKHVPEDLRGLVEQLGRIMSGDRAVFSGEEAKNFLLRYERMGHDEQLHDPNLAALYDPDIADKLKWLSQRVAEKRLRQMNEEELKQISDVVQHIRFLVDNENQVEVAGRKQKVETLAGRLMDEMRKRGVASDNPIMRKLRAVMYKEMTPSYYGKQAGGVMEDLIRDVIKSQSGYAFTVQEGADRMAELVEKHHVNDWLHGENLRFTTKAGDEIELTKNQAMTLYAWWERETRNKLQSGNHLRLGGFTYDRTDKDTRAMKGVNVTGSHVIDAADMEQIRNYLTDEQRAFVADAVKYLSEDLAEKENAMSMKLYGWKKFTEKWYFPYPTDRNFRGQNSTEAAGVAQERKLKNTSATKALTENASNPLKLGNFMDMWAAHVDEMARYSSMTEALENLARVTNWVVGQTAINDGSGNVQIIAPVSVKKEIENALGAEGVRYLEQFLRDANGGVTTDERGFSDKMISLMKKGSVAANLSVMTQQFSAFVRAAYMVNPRYLAAGVIEKGGRKATKARMYKNSGVAIIKKMGRFDTNVGQTGTEYLLDSLKDESKLKRAYSKMDELTGIGAEKADELTWTYLYSVIEAEIDDNTDLERGTKEFDKAVAERFDEVINFTQVYDSTLAKSEWMRSTSTFDKMTTSFMAEPTLWINMLMDAALDLKNKVPGAKGHALRAAAVFVAGSFVNAALQSLATAGRKKKDEGETIVEKYLGELSGNFTDSISLEGIAGMIPIARDVVSLLQGYDVERADMSVISDVVNALRKLQDKVKKGEATPEDWINLGNMALNGLGIPAKNVWRDLSGIYMNIGGWGFGGPTAAPIGTTSGRDIKYAILNNASPFSFFDLWDDSYAAYYQRIADAMIAGDDKTYNELRGYMEETKNWKPENLDSKIIGELAKSLANGLISEEKAQNLLVDKLGMSEKDAYFKVDDWKRKDAWNKAKHEEDEEYKYSKYDSLRDAMKSGGDVKAEIKKLTNHEFKESTVINAIKKQVGAWYDEGEISKAEAEKMLKQYAGITEDDDLYFAFKEFEFNKNKAEGDDTYFSREGALMDAVKKGGNVKVEIKALTDHGYEEKDVLGDIKSQAKKWYKEGEIDRQTAEKIVRNYAGITDENELWFAMDAFEYAKETKDDKNAKYYSDYIRFKNAVRAGKGVQDLKAMVDQYVAHGRVAKNIGNSLYYEFADEYKKLMAEGKKAEAADLKAKIVNGYEASGFSRSEAMKKVDGYLNEKKK